MAITTLNRHDSSPSMTHQRPYDEVYQTPSFNASHPYRHGQARLAQSRHLRQNDTDCAGLSHLQHLSFSADLGGRIRVLGNNGTRNRCKRSMLGRKCLTFCEKRSPMLEWACVRSHKSPAKAKT